MGALVGKKCIKIVHNLHVLSHKGGSHRPTYKPTPIPLPPPFSSRPLSPPLPHSGRVHTRYTYTHIIIKTHTHGHARTHTHTLKINLLPSALRALYNPHRIHYSLHYNTSHHIPSMSQPCVGEREGEEMTHIKDEERKSREAERSRPLRVHPENKLR